jgi:hypothetical protein
MDIKSANAQFSLIATASPTSSNVRGNIEIGAPRSNINFAGTNVAYTLRGIIASGTFEIDLVDASTAGSTSWAAGTAQVETATAAGTITLAGNATITVTAAGMTGSPKAISVAVALSDTAATWAGKVRTALAADSAVSALFNVGGTSTAISLTRKVNSLGILPANDATLNIALANGTCTGITPAATSADTTAGVASTGVNIFDGDGKDFEGIALPSLAAIQAIEIGSLTGTVSYDCNSVELGVMVEGESRLFAGAEGIGFSMNDLEITGNGTQFYLTVLGISN